MDQESIHAICIPVIFVAVLCFCCAAESQIPTYADIVYAEVERQPLHLDLYLSENAPAPTPPVIWIHGG